MFISSTLATLFFLLPLTMYFLWLGMVNRRQNPLVLPGLWDGMALVLGLSGILFGTFPILLQTWYVRLATGPGPDDPASRFEEIYQGFWLINVGYYLLTIIFIAWLLLGGTRKTVVYNVDEDAFVSCLQRAFEESQWNVMLDMDRREAYVKIPRTIACETSLPQAPPEPGSVRMCWDSFGALHHQTLHWAGYQSDDKARFERTLQRVLAEDGRAAENPAATWFLGVGSLLFGFLFFLAVFLLMVLVMPRRL